MPGKQQHESLLQAIDPLSEQDIDLDMLVGRACDARVVLIGEASHGTFDFCDIRAELTRKLISEKGFNAVAVEADWPDAYLANAFVRHRSDDHNATEALADFKRFPLWMWRNTVVRDFLEWLHAYNEHTSDAQQTGIYGLDLYSLRRSMDEVIKYLDTIDPEAAQRARYRYSCFDHYRNNPQLYGYSASQNINQDCVDEVIQQLMEMQR